MNKRNWIMLFAGMATAVLMVLIVYSGANQNSAHKPVPLNPDKAHTNPAYDIHEKITATMFYIGEPASSDNDNIDNFSTSWTTNAVNAYGGVDDPRNRCGLKPCGFTPLENPFYFALPFSDYDKDGPKPPSELSVVPWYDGMPLKSGESILKNRWVKIIYGGKVAYAQWEDAGPFGECDADYVFGAARPRATRAGIDLSPATMDYLEGDGKITVLWQFAEALDVPSGPWKEKVTSSPPKFDS